ncbi:MAG TPA: hypothetical protein VN495_02250 [Candidatus Paceibacterota bacterium]|nr:hypothetical protein [Candidatus Paceibacterota bacterium]
MTATVRLPNCTLAQRVAVYTLACVGSWAVAAILYAALHPTRLWCDLALIFIGIALMFTADFCKAHSFCAVLWFSSAVILYGSAALVQIRVLNDMDNWHIGGFVAFVLVELLGVVSTAYMIGRLGRLMNAPMEYRKG